MRHLVDSTGQLTLARSYEPYGDVLASAGSGVTSYSFTGEWRDGSGLLYLRARYYGPSVGRFFVRDSWPGNNQFPGTLQPYLYGLNNPLRYTDPSGRCIFGIDTAICVGAAIGAAVGGIAGAASTYTGQVTSHLLRGDNLATALSIDAAERNSVISAGIGGVVQGGICGGVAVATLGTSLAVGCGLVGGAAGGAATEFARSLLNGGWCAIYEPNTWYRTGFAAFQGGAVGIATFGLVNSFPILRTLPGQVAFAGTLNGGLQIAGNVWDNDPTTNWDYELGPAIIAGGTNVIVSRVSFAAAKALVSQVPAPASTTSGLRSPYGFPPDPTKPPGPGWEWRGQPDGQLTGRGQWVRPGTPENLHWDPTHHGEPHWDYRAPDSTEYRIWSDGSMTPKDKP